MPVRRSRTTISPTAVRRGSMPGLAARRRRCNCAAVAGRSAHIRTEVRSPASDTMSMNRAGRLDVEREPRPPGPLGRFGFVAGPVTRNLELRHRRSLRRRERNFEIPARHGWIEPRMPSYRFGPAARRPATASGARWRRQCRHAGAARLLRAAHRMRSRRGNGLRRWQRAAKRRRRRVGMDRYVIVAAVIRHRRCQ